MYGYGGGASTGLQQLGWWKIETGFVRQDLVVSPADQSVLRRLAGQVARLASNPRMASLRELWRRHNMLQKTRPLVFCDPENGWNEIVTEAQMECTGKLPRRWEMDLRKEIFWGEEMGDDRPVEPYFDVSYTVTPDDWGAGPVKYIRSDSAGSYIWENAIKDYDRDLPRLHSPTCSIDWETTNGSFDLAQRIFGDLLTVRLKGIWWWSHGITQLAVLFRGLNNVLHGFYDHPDELKELFRVIAKGHLDKLDYLEKNALLSLNNDATYVGSGGFGFTDELPQRDFQGHVRTVDMWGFTESQETVGVSPRMYEEFVFPCEKPIMDRFGLTCYGCCEPIDSRWHVVKQHHNLRRVSCSPWTKLDRMAECLGDRYILSMKPNPAAISGSTFNEAAIRAGLREALAKTRGAVVEIIMKDCHTIGNRPENVVDWCRVAQEEAAMTI